MKRLKLLVLAMAMLLPVAGYAASDYNTMTVGGVNSTICGINAGKMNFGVFSLPNAAVINAQTAIYVKCTNALPYTVTLSKGNSGDFALRRMGSSPNKIDYNIYRDSARTLIWGDNTGGYSGVSETGNGNQQTHTAYARMPALQASIAPGSYVDTIYAYVNW